jgi:hypothetical protein
MKNDNTVNGKCSRCGECCSNLLPLSEKEISDIKDGFALTGSANASMRKQYYGGKI